MKLNDLDRKNYATKALKENFDVNFDTSRLDRNKTRYMLTRVRGLIKEAKSSPDFYENQSSPGYMRLVFMEQALTQHFGQLKSPRIVVENEVVEKSQVILAAQDMVNSIQKMIEDISDMQVKELPALVDGIQSEIGVDQSVQFNQQVGGSLAALMQALTQAKSSMTGSLNTITGEGGAGAFAGAEMDAEALPAGGEEIGAEMGDLETPEEMPEVPAEEPEEVPAGGAGRAKR